MPLTKRNATALSRREQLGGAGRDEALAHGRAERGGLSGRAVELVADPVRAVRHPDEGAQPKRPRWPGVARRWACGSWRQSA